MADREQTIETAVQEHLTQDQRATVSDEIDRLPRLLNEDELPRVLATAEYEGRTGLLVVTPARLVYVREPLEGYGEWAKPGFALREIDSIDGDAATRSLRIRYSGGEYAFANVVRPDRAESIRDFVRGRIPPPSSVGKDRVELLEAEQERLKRPHRAQLQARNARFTWGSTAAAGLLAAAYGANKNDLEFLYPLIVLAALAVFVLIQTDYILNHYLKKNGVPPWDPFRSMTLGELRLAIRDRENELDLASIPKESKALRAEKLFKLHQYELKRYYDQTLRQGATIFAMGIGCIIGGFVIIGAALYVLATHSSSDTSTKLIVGGLGALGAILADFIAAIYLRMFTETLRNVGDFHQTLVGTHHLHFGNFLAANISRKDLQNQTLSNIATELARRYSDRSAPAGDARQTVSAKTAS